VNGIQRIRSGEKSSQEEVFVLAVNVKPQSTIHLIIQELLSFLGRHLNMIGP